MATITEDLCLANPAIEKARKKLLKQQNHEIRMLEQKKKKEAKAIPKDQKPKRMEIYKLYDAKIAKRKEEHITELEALVARMSMQGEDDGNGEKGNAPQAGDVEISAEEKRKQEEEARIKKKKEKALKKRQKKMQKLKDEQKKLNEERSQEVDYRAIENKMIMNNGVSALGLTIKDIKADGNCLFRAIEHQISLQMSNFEMKTSLPEEFLADPSKRHRCLRKMAAQYVRQHENTFSPFLALEDSPEPFSQYCDRMETSSDWGGQIELRALSDLLRCKIEIFSATSPKVTIGEDSFELTIRLSYHKQYYALGNHYNSLH